MLGNAKNTKGVSAIFDIGGGSIGAALVSHGEKNAPPQILYSTRALFPFLKEPDPARLTQAMLSTFVVVALRLQREGLPRLPHLLPFFGSKIPHAYCFFSSPWHSSSVSKLKYAKEKPFTVPKNLGDLLFTDNDSFPRVEFFELEKEVPSKKKKKTSHSSAPHRELGTVSIEQHIIRVYLNGYPTKSPEGKEASTLEALAVGSVVPETLYEKLRDVIDRVLRGGTLEAHSFFMPLSGVARTVFSEKEEYMVIHVGGEICDVAVIEDDAPALFISMPFGIEPLIRSIANKAKIVPEEVGARLALLQGAGIEESADKKGANIVRILAETEGEWRHLIQNALLKAPLNRPLPRKAFIWSEGVHLNWFSNLFAAMSLPEATFSTEPFEVAFKNREAMKNLATFVKDDEYDDALAAEAAFLAF